MNTTGANDAIGLQEYIHFDLDVSAASPLEIIHAMIVRAGCGWVPLVDVWIHVLDYIVIDLEVSKQ